MKKIFPLLLILSILLSACNAGETTAVPNESDSTAQETESAPTEETAAEAVSRLEVDEEALRGLQINVWTPWYGVEQGLFETFVNEFNAGNEWGIRVSAQSQINFTNLYETTKASLPTEGRPDLVIALPEHAQEWFSIVPSEGWLPPESEKRRCSPRRRREKSLVDSILG